MKKLEEIINQEPVFLNSWKSAVGVLKDFCDYDFWDKSDEQIIEKFNEPNILFASYGCDNYMGDAFVLLERDGKLYEVHGSHCSCYGLEDQWSEESVLLEELEHRLLNGTLGEDRWSGNEFKKQLCEFLDVEVVYNY